MIKPKKEKKEPWWKKRLEGQIRELQRDLQFVKHLIDKKTMKKKWRDYLQRKYNIQQKKPNIVKKSITYCLL